MVGVVTAANVSDPAGAQMRLSRLQGQCRCFQRLWLIYTNGTYRGKVFVKKVFDTYRWWLEAVMRSDRQRGFRVLPRRWTVKRTFGWLQ